MNKSHSDVSKTLSTYLLLLDFGERDLDFRGFNTMRLLLRGIGDLERDLFKLIQNINHDVMHLTHFYSTNHFSVNRTRTNSNASSAKQL